MYWTSLTKQFLVGIVFYTSNQHSFLVFSSVKKPIQARNNLRLSKWRHSFHLCVNYPIKLIYLS